MLDPKRTTARGALIPDMDTESCKQCVLQGLSLLKPSLLKTEFVEVWHGVEVGHTKLARHAQETAVGGTRTDARTHCPENNPPMHPCTHLPPTPSGPASVGMPEVQVHQC